MIKATFDRISIIYNILEKYIFRECETIREMIDQYIILKDNSKIIDIGGGTGVNIEFIANKGYDVTLLDFSRNMLLEANNSKFKLIWGDGTCLPIKNNTYDITLLINSLHHVNKNLHQNFIDESFRILKPGGKMYVIEVLPSDYNGDERIKRPILRIIDFLLFKKLTLIYFKIEQLIHDKAFHQDPSSIESMCKNSGFKDYKIILPKNSNSKYIVCGTK